MTVSQLTRAEYELSKYLQPIHDNDESLSTHDAAFRGALNDRIEVTIERLAMQGAFLFLNDVDRLHFIAGGHRVDANASLFPIEFQSENSKWLQIEDDEVPTWKLLLRDIIAIVPSANHSSSEQALNIPALQKDPRTSGLSIALGPAQFSFFAGVPLTSRNGHNIGAICVVDRKERLALSAPEVTFLTGAARRCMGLLELARERGFQKRWIAMQKELDNFLKSRTLHAQITKEPQTLAGRKSSKEKDHTARNEDRAERVDPSTLAEEPFSGIDNPPVEGSESQRLVSAEIKRDQRLAERDNAMDAQSLTAERGKDDERGSFKGETTYRKVFRRAAECLRSALQADGVMFVDGLIGFHGDVQPVAEPEQEVEREIARPPRGESFKQEGAGSRTGKFKGGPDSNGFEETSAHSRTYTSTEYTKGYHVDRPAEILGISGIRDVLKMTQVSQSTLGLSEIDEGFLQRLMTRHPNGAVWYMSNSGLKQVKEETLEEVDLEEETQVLTDTFRGIRQLVFKPLTDPNSLKRLGACFAWRMKSTPLFTDAVDLGSLKAFLHVVESEIARFDASSAAKQKEAFVSSVSHELRTPLHGILGAVQLLDESGLNSTQRSLANMITSCGSTLHETLTSVLSYAKINQFERRQHEYRRRRPPDSVWALPNKEGFVSGPDRDYEGLYICTDLALLCEEILGVLEAGKSFQNSRGNVVVVCNIEYNEVWNYFTEPGALRRIAVNLIGNSLKYTENGSVVVSLSTVKHIKDSRRISNDLTTGRTLVITIRDAGRGISRDFMDNHLFLPFTQEDSTSSHGVGLGMSIVKSLVSLLSGELTVQSELNQGTEITIKIPMRMCSSADQENGQVSFDWKRNEKILRDRKLAVVMYGFPQYVRDSLINYFATDARPDVVMVDEGNKEIEEAVQNTAHAYGKHAVLLSIVTIPSRLGNRTEIIDGYFKWERLPRPLGPNSVAKGLLSCLDKLDELQKYGENSSIDQAEAREEENHREGPAGLPEFSKTGLGEQYMPSLEKLQISAGSQASLTPSDSPWSSSLPAKPTADNEKAEVEKKPPNNSEGQKVGIESEVVVSEDLRILIVDDNALNLRLLGTFFEKNSYHNIQQAKHGREAVEAAQSCTQGFDIIFMDLSMPIMDGFEATRLIRKMETDCERALPAREPVIIALTGLASQEDEDHAFDAGVDLYLTKPVRFPKLFDLLKQYKDGTLKRRTRSDVSSHGSETSNNAAQ